MITAGEVLKDKRERLRKSLDTVSLDTKIQKRFIKYIENNQFSYFDSEVFLTGFIKIYAKYLDLDVEKVLALYRRSKPTQKKEVKTEEKKNTRKRKNPVTPQNIIYVSIAIFLVAILGYIGFQIYRFQTPPTIEIFEPKDNATLNEEVLIIKGKTEREILLEINDTLVETDSDGTFEKEISLTEGSNLITIKGRRQGNSSLETVVIRKITYEIPEIVEIEEEKISQTFKLEVIDSPAWIKLDIDGENKISKVVEPSIEEFEVTETLYIITGRISSTKIYWNDELLDFGNNRTAGVAELTCNVSDTELVCE